MNEEKVEMKIKTRIVEIDRKIAAQLADVWIDMKQRIESDIASKVVKKEPSKLKEQVKQD